jgi:hypothetical protein
MVGRIIDLNQTDALVSFEDGTTKEVGIIQLPTHAKIGDMVDINPHSMRMTNEKLIDFF